MFHLLGSIIVFLLSFAAFIFLGVLVLAVILFATMRRNVNNLRGKNKGANGQKKSDSTNRSTSSGAQNVGPIATDFEQPIYDDENAEYVDYEEVK